MKLNLTLYQNLLENHFSLIFEGMVSKVNEERQSFEDDYNQLMKVTQSQAQILNYKTLSTRRKMQDLIMSIQPPEISSIVSDDSNHQHLQQQQQFDGVGSDPLKNEEITDKVSNIHNDDLMQEEEQEIST